MNFFSAIQQNAPVRYDIVTLHLSAFYDNYGAFCFKVM